MEVRSWKTEVRKSPFVLLIIQMDFLFLGGMKSSGNELTKVFNRHDSINNKVSLGCYHSPKYKMVPNFAFLYLQLR